MGNQKEKTWKLKWTLGSHRNVAFLKSVQQGIKEMEISRMENQTRKNQNDMEPSVVSGLYRACTGAHTASEKKMGVLHYCTFIVTSVRIDSLSPCSTSWRVRGTS